MPHQGNSAGQELQPEPRLCQVDALVRDGAGMGEGRIHQTGGAIDKKHELVFCQPRRQPPTVDGRPKSREHQGKLSEKQPAKPGPQKMPRSCQLERWHWCRLEMWKKQTPNRAQIRVNRDKNDRSNCPTAAGNREPMNQGKQLHYPQKPRQDGKALAAQPNDLADNLHRDDESLKSTNVT